MCVVAVAVVVVLASDAVVRVEVVVWGGIVRCCCGSIGCILGVSVVVSGAFLGMPVVSCAQFLDRDPSRPSAKTPRQLC